MATITDRLGRFTGQIGPVRFLRGVAETDDPDMVAYFAADPDRWDVEHDDQPELIDAPDPGPQPERLSEYPDPFGDDDPQE